LGDLGEARRSAVFEGSSELITAQASVLSLDDLFEVAR